MPEARLSGITINYEVAGEGPAVLLTHGSSATGRMWKPQAEALKDSYRIISWDMRGHGQTDSPDDPAQYSEELTIGDMLALLQMLDTRPAVVGGLSLGGFMSLPFHLPHPPLPQSHHQPPPRHPRPYPGHRRRTGRALPRPERLHGRQDPRRPPRGHPQRRPRR